MSEFSVIVQGPFNKISLDTIEYYKTLGPVIISYWDTEECPLQDSGCVLVKQPLPDLRYYHNSKGSTFTYQIESIRLGLQQVRTPFVIRTRSDESWGNLEPLITKFKENINRVVCGNIFFKQWNNIPMHFGDHLFVGWTHRLLSAYTDMFINANLYQGMYCAENVAAKAIMSAYGKTHYDKQNFEEVFEVVDINLLKPFVASWQHANKCYTDDFWEPGLIRSMDEL